MGLSNINVVAISGYVGGEVVEDRSRGLRAIFDLVMDSEYQDGARYVCTVPIISYGKRAERCLQLRPKTRLTVQGELIEHEGRLAVFSNWIEYGSTPGGRRVVVERGGLSDLLGGTADE